MRLEYQIIAALALDLLIGDPRWFPHPVKLIGRFAVFLETPSRKFFQNPRIAGVAAVISVLTATGLITYLITMTAGLLHPFIADAVSIILLYTTFAAIHRNTYCFYSLEFKGLSRQLPSIDMSFVHQHFNTVRAL